MHTYVQGILAFAGLVAMTALGVYLEVYNVNTGLLVFFVVVAGAYFTVKWLKGNINKET